MSRTIAALALGFVGGLGVAYFLAPASRPEVTPTNEAHVAALFSALSEHERDASQRFDRLERICQKAERAPSPERQEVPTAPTIAIRPTELAPALERIESAVASHSWTADDVVAFRAAMSTMNREEKQAAVTALMRALNERGLQLSAVATPF